MNVDIELEFRGGHGMANVEIQNTNGKIGSHTFSESGTWEIGLPEDNYVIELNGVSPPEGTTIEINKPTSPPTPDKFSAGPFRRNYTLVLK